MPPTQGERSTFYGDLCKEEEKWPTQCQPSLSTANHSSCHVYSNPWSMPKSVHLPLLLVQNLSPQCIASRDVEICWQSLLVQELKHSHYFVINLLHVLWEYVSGTSYWYVHDPYQVTHEYAMRLECVTIVLKISLVCGHLALLLPLHTYNKTDGNQLVIFFSTGLHGDAYICIYIALWYIIWNKQKKLTAVRVIQ